MAIPEKYHQQSREWVRCKADEVAIKRGMFMDVERGEKVVNWIESNCYLYEGSRAGEPIKLLTAWREFIVRLFGWVRWSKQWNCFVRRFREFGFWGAKKNGKSTLVSAILLFLLLGDGEGGPKFTSKTTRTHRRNTTLMSELRKRITLIHEL